MKYLTYRQRIQIETLYRHKTPVSEIASEVGVSVSCIYKELKKGSVILLDTHLREYNSYSADVAQQRHDYAQTSKGRPVKLGSRHDLAHLLERLIKKEKYSPAAALAEAKKLGFENLPCYTTLYSWISKGVLDLKPKDLPRQGGRKKKKDVEPLRPHRVPEAPGIDDRPELINSRQELGHWEMDLVCGKLGTRPVLLVLTERASRFEIIRKLADKTMASVVSEVKRLSRHYDIKTLTVDNGSEFRDYFGLKNCVNEVYYCHPYRSGERGSNENANAMIRRWIPKGTPIDDYSDEFISRVEHWMNHYPRQLLDFHCAADFAPFLQIP